MKARFGLTPKLALAFTLFAAVLLAAVMALGLGYTRANLQAGVVAELQASAIEKEAALEDWIAERQSDLSALAVSPRLREAAAAVASAPPASSEFQRAHRQLVAELRTHTGSGQPYLELLLIEIGQGRILASTDAWNEGKYREDRPYFVHGQNAPYVQDPFFALDLEAPTMVAAMPLIGLDGRRSGVLAGRINLDEMHAVVGRRTGLRQTDEAFLVNTSNLFLTQPRLAPDASILLHGTYSEPARRCLARQSGALLAEDYRGVPVVAVYRWLPARNMCLIAKMDQAEAFAPAGQIGRLIAGIAILALVVAAVAGLGLARALTRPLRDLVDGTVEIGQGHWQHRLAVGAQDEFGTLAAAFNEMAAKLEGLNEAARAWAATLEDRVAQRTAELSESEERFRATFEQAAVGLAHVAPDGRWLRVNRRLCDIAGYTESALRAQRFQDITHPDDLDADLEQVRRILAGDIQDYDMEKRYVRRDGSTVWINLNVSLVREPSGAPKYFISVIEDITDRRRAEEERRNYAERLESLRALDRAILAAQSPRAIALAAISRLRKIVACTRASLVLFDFDEGVARYVAVDMEGDLRPPGGAMLPLAEFSPVDILRRGPIRYVEDLAALEPLPAALAQGLAQGIRCVASAPLVVEGELVGELNLSDTRPRALAPEHLETMREVADQLAVALQQAQLRQALESHAAELERRVEERTEQLANTVRKLEDEIAQRLWAEEEATKFAALVQNSMDFIAIADMDGAVLFVNEAGRRLAGIEPHVDTRSTTIADYLTPEGLLASQTVEVPAILATGHWEGETTLRHWPSNQPIPVHINSFILTHPQTGAPMGLATVQRDITERKRAEAARAELFAKLEAKATELEAANRELEAFAYSVSHDLRAPLRAIDGFARMLAEDYAAALDAEGARYLKVVRDNTRQMDQLINDLLRLSRLSRQPLEKLPVAPADVARQAWDDLQTEHKERPVQFTVGELPACEADPALLKQVFVNLLSNALKFTRQQEAPVIEVGCRHDEQQLVYFVADNGIGFDMQYADRLFHVFNRLHLAEEYEGSGVGLAIVQRVILRHGGRVWAEAEVGQGATFMFTL